MTQLIVTSAPQAGQTTDGGCQEEKLKPLTYDFFLSTEDTAFTQAEQPDKIVNVFVGDV